MWCSSGQDVGTCGQQCGAGARGKLAGHVRRLGDCLPPLPAASLQVFSELPQEVQPGGVPFLLRGPVSSTCPASPPVPHSPQDVQISIRAGGTLTRVTVSARGRVSVRTHTERPVQTSPPPARPPVTTASRDTSSVPQFVPHIHNTPETVSDMFPSVPLPAADTAPPLPPEDTPAAPQSPPQPPPETKQDAALDSDSESVVEGTPHKLVLNLKSNNNLIKWSM